MNERDLARLAELREMKRELKVWNDSLDEDDAEELKGLEEQRKAENRVGRLWSAWNKHQGQVWRATLDGEQWYSLEREQLGDNPYSIDELIGLGAIVELVDKPEVDDRWAVEARSNQYFPPEEGA